MKGPSRRVDPRRVRAPRFFRISYDILRLTDTAANVPWVYRPHVQARGRLTQAWSTPREDLMMGRSRSVARRGRGRPQKFGRPGELVQLTLPTDVIRGLRQMDDD